jgi:hypothetical protein
MATTGAYPPDFTTDVGRFRLLIGDLNATDVTGGEGQYTFFGDTEIAGYLTLNTSIYRAAGMALNALATQAADQAQSIRDYDLQVDLRQRAEQFREQAKQMFAQADLADAESDEAFQIVDTGSRPECLTKMVLPYPNQDDGFGFGFFGLEPFGI